ncbi:hypothetical protein Fcan01_23709 [Folsomia candida]|uniref:Uncharacterized protein n=1 Tax=Folsomia candida TaxID=158441 RepID=A0A226D716_FOLCA|nr:hypothetical protein Fcan01_23709 [Folsomia candida]
MELQNFNVIDNVLEGLNLGQYKEVLKENSIDDSLLKTLHQSGTLVTNLIEVIPSLGHRLQILGALNNQFLGPQFEIILDPETLPATDSAPENNSVKCTICFSELISELFNEALDLIAKIVKQPDPKSSIFEEQINQLKDPFAIVKTDYLLKKYLTEMDFYIPPKEIILGSRVITRPESVVQFDKFHYVPIKRVLEKVLCLPGVMERILKPLDKPALNLTYFTTPSTSLPVEKRLRKRKLLQDADPHILDIKSILKKSDIDSHTTYGHQIIDATDSRQPISYPLRKKLVAVSCTSLMNKTNSVRPSTDQRRQLAECIIDQLFISCRKEKVTI